MKFKNYLLSMVLALVLVLGFGGFALADPPDFVLPGHRYDINITGDGLVGDINNVNQQQQGQFQGQTQNQSAIATNNVGNGIGNFSPSATGGSATINDNSKTYNTNTNLNTNTNVNSLNNNQTIAPVQTNKQTINIEKPFAPAPNVSGPAELGFGKGRMNDVTLGFPKFALYGITPLGKDDVILEVISVTANEPIKRIYKTILKEGKSVAENNTGKLRFQIIEAEAQKSWTTGGSLAGSGTGVMGTTGFGSSGGFIPQVGGTKAHFLYTVIFLKVS